MKILSVVLCLLVLAVPCLSSAEEAQKQNFRGVDITPVTRYFARLVRVVQKPFYLYHWRRNADLVNSVDVQLNPQKYGVSIVKEEGPGFMSGLYAPARSPNTYGGGLYAAVDPIITEGYGGDRETWALLAMRIPMGFQMIDLRTPEPNMTPRQEQDLSWTLQSFNCPVWFKSSRADGFVGELLRATHLEPACADLVAHLLRSFKVEGFLYSYSVTGFARCQSSTDRSLAVVFTASSWLEREGAEAELYTAHTSVNADKRRVIESAFQYANTFQAVKRQSLMLDWQRINPLLNAKVPETKGTYNLIKIDYRCDPSDRCVSACEIEYTVGKEKVSRTVALTEADFVGQLFPTYPLRFSFENPEHAHWLDLEATPTTENPAEWVRQNIFECGDERFLSTPLRSAL